MQKLKNVTSFQSFQKGRFARFGAGVLVALVIFALGISVGDGRISFGTSRLNSSLPSSLNFSSVNQVYQALKDNYNGKLTTSQLLDGLKEGLAQSTADPYTEYFTASEAKQFNDELNNSFSGIGAELGADSSGNIEIIAPIDGSPAAKAGIKPKDVIATINGASTSGLSPDTAVNKIRGPAGTKVTLGIVRGGTQQQNFTITRANITVPSVMTKILPGNIGYMQISSFSDDTSNLAEQAAQKFVQKDHVKSVILDLRNNPGGEVDAAVNVSSLWLPSGKMIMQERGNENQTYTSTGYDPLHGLPTVVLVNDGSASASEITAGALHDNGAATIIGTKTFGKGVVQAILGMSGGAELKVTVASWYRPNGQNIEHKGITPDKIVQLTDAEAKAGNDTQLKAAEALLQKR
ncbi:MAG TPA: S41 family peptidase [Candidatus Saccharimonadales bacterium]